jgi:hypothetical protein
MIKRADFLEHRFDICSYSCLHFYNSGADRYYAMQHAEKAVTLYDEFRNNTLYVPTGQFMNYPGNDTYNGGYHYDGRADVYTHIGRAFGHGMLKLLRTKHHHNHPNPIATGVSAQTLRGANTMTPRPVA